MKINEYQQLAVTTDMFEEVTKPITDVFERAFMAKVLGLAGETGEISEKFKKILRDRGGKLTTDDILDFKKELGDCLWYIAVISDYLGLNLEDVAKTNISKLKNRQTRGVLGGSGDSR